MRVRCKELYSKSELATMFNNQKFEPMKKLIQFLLVITISFNFITVSAQTDWININTPEALSAIAINDTVMVIFGLSQYYESPVSSVMEWTTHSLPISEMVVSAEFVGDDLYVLFDGGDLYVLKDSVWNFVLSNIKGISQNSERMFAWSSEWINEFNESGLLYQVPFSAATYVACGSSVIVSDDYVMFQGDSLNQLSFLKEFDMSINEIFVTEDQYLYLGKVTGNLAAYHISPIDVSYKYDHILTEGELNSAALYNGNIYLAGRLGAKGVIFDAHDMSRIDWFSEEIVRMRASNKAIIAMGIESLHMKLNTYTGSVRAIEDAELQGSMFQVTPNPIEAGMLRIIAKEKTQAQVLSIEGRQVSQIVIEEGINNVNVQGWKSGMYLVSSPKGSVKFIIK